jgi:hypothetical protein
MLDQHDPSDREVKLCDNDRQQDMKRFPAENMTKGLFSADCPVGAGSVVPRVDS